MSIMEMSIMEKVTTVGHKLVVVGTFSNDFPRKSTYSTSENSAPESEKSTLGNTLPCQPTSLSKFIDNSSDMVKVVRIIPLL